LVSMVTHLY